MSLRDFLLFSALTGAIALAAHWLVRRYWPAVWMSAFVSSLSNVTFVVVANNFATKPSAVIFWLPMMLVFGVIAALPAVAIIGIPFYVVRCRRSLLEVGTKKLP